MTEYAFRADWTHLGLALLAVAAVGAMYLNQSDLEFGVMLYRDESNDRELWIEPDA